MLEVEADLRVQRLAVGGEDDLRRAGAEPEVKAPVHGGGVLAGLLGELDERDSAAPGRDRRQQRELPVSRAEPEQSVVMNP